MRTLQAAICTLEPQIEDHAREMFSVLCDPAIYEFEGTPPPSVEALRYGYERRESRVSPDGCEQWLNWVVRLPDGELTGYVQATVLRGGVSYVAYEFSSRFWRRGIATASISTMLDELAENYQVSTFVAVLKQANFRSMALLRKLGFTNGTADDFIRFEAETDEIVLLLTCAVRHEAS